MGFLSGWECRECLFTFRLWGLGGQNCALHPNSCVGYNCPLSGSQCSAEGFLLPLVGAVRREEKCWEPGELGFSPASASAQGFIMWSTVCAASLELFFGSYFLCDIHFSSFSPFVFLIIFLEVQVSLISRPTCALNPAPDSFRHGLAWGVCMGGGGAVLGRNVKLHGRT